MGIVLFSEDGRPELAQALGDPGDVASYLLLDAPHVPSLAYCEADVVLLDCGSNVDRGLRALRGLKDRCPGTPVIFVTDSGTEETAIAAFRTGARDYFRKPVNMVHLQDTVRRLISLRRSASEPRVPLRSAPTPVASGTPGAAEEIPKPVMEALAYLERHFTEEVSLEQLAGIASMSKFHFTRVFKRHLGMSPVQFRTHLRIQHAKSLLVGGWLPVSKIAEDVGFNDISNFIRHFKKITGSTPNRYRSRVRRGTA